MTPFYIAIHISQAPGKQLVRLKIAIVRFFSLHREYGTPNATLGSGMLSRVGGRV